MVDPIMRATFSSFLNILQAAKEKRGLMRLFLPKHACTAAALICSLTMIIKPDKDPSWPDIKTLIKLFTALIVLILYAFSLKTFGFLLPTALASAALSYLIQPSIFKSSATGLILSLSLFTIFKFGLGLSLFPFPKFLLG